MKILNRNIIAFFIILIGFVLSACEDAPPTDYKTDYVIEGYMIVNEPIRDIRFYRTQALTDTFKYESGFISDAKVELYDGENYYNLKYRFNGSYGEYYYEDSTILVKPSKTYSLKVSYQGKEYSAETTTPEPISWTVKPKRILQYPLDTLNLPSPDSLAISWTKAANASGYLLSVKCLDTVEYGKYLEPPSSDKNRRIYRFFEDDSDPEYKDITRWGFLMSNSTPTVWIAFKWFGYQEVTIYASDKNFFNWYKMLAFSGNPRYNQDMSNIKGGALGMFGSASAVRDTVFLIKNRI